MIFYVLNIGGFIANVEWFNQSLPQFFGQPLVSLQSPDLGHTPLFPETILRSSAAPVIATLQVGMKTLPAVLTGLLIYSGLSAANASLYVASRTLYGLTRNLSDNDPRFLFRMAAKLNVISPRTRVPLWSLVVSVLVFSSWLPFIRIHSGYSQADVCPNTSFWDKSAANDNIQLQKTFVSIGSTGCLLVWASQCLAFIRYNKWYANNSVQCTSANNITPRLWMHREELQGEHLQQFQRWPQRGFSSWASALQPGPAYVGLISCLVIVFILNSASLWNERDSMPKALTIFLGVSRNQPSKSILHFHHTDFVPGFPARIPPYDLCSTKARE
jgi:amino acid transporter